MSVLGDLESSGLRPVLEAALKRYRRDGELRRSQPELPPDAWLALSRLTGEPPRRTLDLAVLNQALLNSRHAVSLVDVLAELNGGPVHIRRQEKETMSRQWDAAVDEVPHVAWQTLLREGRGGTPILKAELKRLGSVTEIVQLVSRALKAVREAPSFPVLAAQVCGDAHALDTDRLAGRVFRAVLDDLVWPHPERDGVSRTVLCAGLLGTDWLRAALGHCLAIPLREVLRLPVIEVPGQQIYVVENPSVFEALHEAFPGLPIICTQGQPGTAVTELLRRLPRTTTAHLSCDLDVGGLRIATFLMREVELNWQPWRMDPQSYALACARGGLPLAGAITCPAEVLAGLAEEMATSGIGGHQENLLPELVEDLARTITGAGQFT